MNQNLTPREKQIVELVNAGLSFKEIGEEIGCSVGTVDSHVKNIKTKTGLQKATEISTAYTWKKYRLPLIDLPERVRKRIAAALVVLSVAGVFLLSRFLGVVRFTDPGVRVIGNTGANLLDKFNTQLTWFESNWPCVLIVAGFLMAIGALSARVVKIVATADDDFINVQ